MTDERRRRIRAAALEVFLRYGYRKVTMDDIARGVGVSRPALYLVFPGKEAVFRDVVQAGLDEMLAEIERGLAEKATLAEQLDLVFQISSVRAYEQVARAPSAGELLNASFDFAKDVFAGFERRLVDLLARLIRAAVEAPDALLPPAHARARVLVAAAHGCKAAATDVQDLRAILADLVRMTVAGLPAATKGTRPRRRPSGGNRPR